MKAAVALLLVPVAAVLAAAAAEEEPAPPEPLYDSSDPGLPWPPAGADPSAWPGAGERLGKHWPRSKVAVLPEPPEFAAFEREYMLGRRPVVVEGLVERMARKSGFRLEGGAGATSGRAAVSNVMAQFGGRPDIRCPISHTLPFHKYVILNTFIFRTMPFRDLYLRSEAGKDIFLRDHLHKNFKTQFLFPDMLKCGEVADVLLDTRWEDGIDRGSASCVNAYFLFLRVLAYATSA